MRRSLEQQFDLAVVGAGIVGLAHALAAARLGKRVVVDRDAQANGASVRNFGFVTVTGQARGEVWRRAQALGAGLERSRGSGRDRRCCNAA
jgi:glycine/D-amino acid oxidase-like deaminating enzyme